MCNFYLRGRCSAGLVEEEFATKGGIARRSGNQGGDGHFAETRRSMFAGKLKEESEKRETPGTSQ